MSKKSIARRRNNLILFGLNFIYIFILGLFTPLENMHFAYYTLISAIILVSILTVRREGGKWFVIPIGIVISTWVAEMFDLLILATITGYLSTAFFLFVIVFLIIRIANSDKIGMLEFLESINVYLLLGIGASILFGIVYAHNHDAYNMHGEVLSSEADFIYYSFVTLTTLGYGDITPNNSIARSISIFFSVAGQLYLTMIIAMLVGKYLNQKSS